MMQSASVLAHCATPTPAPQVGVDVSLIGVARSYLRDQEVFAEGGATTHLYKVVSGAVREVRLLSDGRRQVTAFHLPGDVFGLELGAARRTTAEVVTDTTLVVARRQAVLVDGDQALALLRMAMDDLGRAREHVVTLGRRNAAERMATFLLDFADRTESAGLLDLPMSRQDIADHLGLTIETVSRTFTQFHAEGLIEIVSCRRIRLADVNALSALHD